MDNTSVRQPLTPEEMLEVIAEPIETRADTREQEDSLYVGGMRNPNIAVASNTSTRAMGNISRRVLEDIADDQMVRVKYLKHGPGLATPKPKGSATTWSTSRS